MEMMFTPSINAQPLEFFFARCTPVVEELFARLYGYDSVQMGHVCSGMHRFRFVERSVQSHHLQRLNTVKLHVEQVGDILVHTPAGRYARPVRPQWPGPQ